MKNLLFLSLAVLLFFASCSKGKWREKEQPDPRDVFVSTPWQIDQYVVPVNDIYQDCRIARELVFRKDSTGYFYYAIKCDSNDKDTLKFMWWISKDNTKLYFNYVDSVYVSTPYILRIYHADYDMLRTQPWIYGPNKIGNRLIDGFFVPKGSK
jgi:hypothetical protein